MSHHTNMLSLFTLWSWFLTKFILRGYLCLFITNILKDSVHTFYICLVPKHYCFTMTHPVPIMDRALYDRDLHHKIVKNCEKLKWRQREFPASSFRFMLLKLCEYIPKLLCFTFLNRVEFIQCLLSESFGKLITPQNVDFQLLHQYVKVS